jgi:hypothetical protein
MSETTTTTTNAPAPATNGGAQQPAGAAAPAPAASAPASASSGPSEREKQLADELAKYKEADRKRAEDEAKAKGDYEQLLKLEREKAAKAELELQRRQADDRKRAIVERSLDGVAPERRADAHGRLLVLQEQHGWDPHAEDVDKAVAERRAALEKAVPDLFAKKKPATTTGTGEKPPTSGEQNPRARPTRPAWQQRVIARP